MPCYCYMVECADGSYYTGWTTDPLRRTKVHNAGRGARYTRSRRPVRLVFIELEETRSAAMKRERAIKSLPRSRKRHLIDGAATDLQKLRRVAPVQNARRRGALSESVSEIPGDENL